jgi:hypothetical protein
MQCAAHNWLIDINIAVPDFQIETALWVCANPGFIVNCCPLATEIRQRNEVPNLTLLTFRKIVLFHEVHLPTELNH